jgi:hypothetical protein
MFEKIKIKLKEKEYEKYIYEHRENVRKAFVELTTCPDLDWLITEDLSYELFKRIEKHDLSKYSDEEFDAYRRYYHPISQEEKDNAKKDYEEAWEHHLTVNDHHWQHRQYMENTLTEEIQLACLENICDWLAMGYKFNDRPIQYYNKHKKEIRLPETQIAFMEKVMNDLEKTKRDMSKYGTI